MISTAGTAVSTNRLLAALPIDELKEFSSYLEPVKLRCGEVIYQPDAPIKHIYFPETCIISQLTIFSDGSSVESGIVGREGMTGVSVALSHIKPTREVCVQTSGRGYRIETEKFRRALESRNLYEVVIEYNSVFNEQVAQAGACSNHHPANQRLARLLLMTHDRVKGNSFFMTHDFIAQMLGIYRPSVTIAAIELKEKGLIDYSRGTITIKDRAGLEAEACECYELIAKIYRSFNEFLELRYLNQRMEQVNQMMAHEMNRRRELQKTASAQVEKLQQAMLGVKTARALFSICNGCQHIRDENGSWQFFGDFLQTQLKTRIEHRFCPTCRTK